jgi:hypothetical protein
MSGHDVQTVAGVGCVGCNGGTDVDQTAVRRIQLEDISRAGLCSGSEQFCDRNVVPDEELHKVRTTACCKTNMTAILDIVHLLGFFQTERFGT